MWYGLEAQLVVTEPQLIKEILSDKHRAYPKREPREYTKKLLGNGLVTAQGEKWFKQRKLANHAFHAETLKVNQLIFLVPLGVSKIILVYFHHY